MTTRRFGRHIKLVMALAAALMVLGTGTAVAAPNAALASIKIYQGGDYAIYYTTSDYLYACDKEADGRGVFAEYRGTGTKHGYIWDGNGSKSGCGYDDVGSITRFRVCEAAPSTNYCSPWVYT